jgi:hypothetical protein
MKNSDDTIGNQTRDLPTCSAVPQPTALPRAPHHVMTESNHLGAPAADSASTLVSATKEFKDAKSSCKIHVHRVADFIMPCF